MLILIAIGVFVILVAATMYFYYRYTKASEALFAARRDRARYQARLQAVQKTAREAEERCTHLMRQVNTSMASTGQALNIARHIEVVRQQLEELLEVIAYPDRAGRHAYADAPLPLEPGMTPYSPRELDSAALPHNHTDHTAACTRAVPGPTVTASWLRQPDLPERRTA